MAAAARFAAIAGSDCSSLPLIGTNYGPGRHTGFGGLAFAPHSRGRYFFVRSRRLRSAIRARSVRQSFHAFGNDLAELHHLLAQSRVFDNFAMDPVAVGTQLFAQVA